VNPPVRTFDPSWEGSIYAKGLQLNRYPFDPVVSFIFRHAPREKPRSDIRILEVGCGAGNNLWFAAREGYQVAGIDGSRSAIEYARQRFAEEGLAGSFCTGDFTDELPFEDGSFDLAIDRLAVSYSGLTGGRRAVADVRRVLVPNGRFFFNPFSDRHDSALSGREGPDGLRLDVTTGALAGTPQVCFYSERDVRAAVGDGWRLVSLRHVGIDHLVPEPTLQAEWYVVAEKAAPA
jgi:SAM-dependent methyltransferase